VSGPGVAAPQTNFAKNEIRFLWQGMRLLQEQTDEVIKTYVYDPNREYAPIARIDHPNGSPALHRIYHYHSDPTGTPREVTNEEGTLVWEGNYKAWGELRANTAPPSGFSQNLRMPGQYYDEESGLHYNT
ncbi:RHS domain-containing protein, partial [Neisseriaceae bacterium TC5R-5]|nr:RHS domain-containing protein [Neisseriaceae bacterium TC5R-5]